MSSAQTCPPFWQIDPEHVAKKDLTCHKYVCSKHGLLSHCAHYLEPAVNRQPGHRRKDSQSSQTYDCLWCITLPSPAFPGLPRLFLCQCIEIHHGPNSVAIKFPHWNNNRHGSHTAYRTSKTFVWVTTRDLKTIWHVHVTFFGQTSFRPPNVPQIGQMLDSCAPDGATAYIPWERAQEIIVIQIPNNVFDHCLT